MKEGGGGGEGRKETFLPLSLPALLLAPFFARSLVLVPRSLLLNRRETLATQVSVLTQGNSPKMTKVFLEYLSFEGMVEGRNYLPFYVSHIGRLKKGQLELYPWSGCTK